MLCRTIDILVQSHDPPFTVRVRSYCLLNKIFVFTYIRILCVQDDKQRVAICKIVISANIAVIAQAAHVCCVKMIGIIRVVRIMISYCSRYRNTLHDIRA